MSKIVSDTTANSKPHYHGHRQRLKERYAKAPLNVFADYELLEMLLCMAQPRKDMKPLAKKLLDHFGTIAEVISADPGRLQTVPGCGEGTVLLFKMVHDIALRMARYTARELPVLSSLDRVIDYCHIAMAYEEIEQVRVLFLNQKHHLMIDEVLQEGTVNQTAIYPREIVKRALELSASGLILVHNHPSGDPTPSQQDIAVTQDVKKACDLLSITLHDHIVISRGSYISLRAMGQI